MVEAAPGPGACCGLSWDLWAEEGGVEGVRQGLGQRGTYRWPEPRHGPGAPSTHTGLELGVDVVQRVKGLVQDVVQG